MDREGKKFMVGRLVTSSEDIVTIYTEDLAGKLFYVTFYAEEDVPWEYEKIMVIYRNDSIKHIMFLHRIGKRNIFRSKLIYELDSIITMNIKNFYSERDETMRFVKGTLTVDEQE